MQKSIIITSVFIIIFVGFNFYKSQKFKKTISELEDQNPIYIDVRTVSEYQAGHNPKARNIPLGQFSPSQIQEPKDKTIVVVCRSGARSSQAIEQLRSAGFTNVYNGGSWNNIPK